MNKCNVSKKKMKRFLLSFHDRFVLDLCSLSLHRIQLQVEWQLQFSLRWRTQLLDNYTVLHVPLMHVM